MYELIQAGEKSYYIECPAKIGVYTAADGVYLIDSGNDKEAGRKVRQVLDRQGWKLLGILNTHSNADHIGGNAYLQKQTGCKVFAGGIEGDFTRHPILEPSFLYGGYPPAPLRHKFLMAQESEVTDLSDPAFPREVEIIPLPGHFFSMVGFRTPDGTAYLADCLSSRAALDKYGIPFIYDVAAYLDTLSAVEAMEAPLFVPAHAEASADVRELAQYNRVKVLEAAERILAVCQTPHTFEAILKALFEQYGLAMSMEQYALVGSTVRSYLSWLADTERVRAVFAENTLLWETT